MRPVVFALHHIGHAGCGEQPDALTAQAKAAGQLSYMRGRVHAAMIIGKYEATIYPERDGWTGAISLGFDPLASASGSSARAGPRPGSRISSAKSWRDLAAAVTAAAGYTVADAISDFLDQGMKGKSPETVSNYRPLADHHLIPQLGAGRLKKLTADELDTWMDDRAEELSTRTLGLIHQVLERAIRHAQARDKVRRNVASLIIVPEGQEGRSSKAMTLDRAIQLLDQVVPGGEHRLAAYVVVSLLAGVRTEEARALAWAEVDLDAGTMAVYRSVRAKGDTKTRKSRRLLKLPRRAVESLRDHRKRQAAERLRAGEQWQDHDLVFCREDGTPLDRWQVRREFAVITRAAGLGEQWAPRELRHSFVSILSAHGVRIEDISDLMGHSGTTVTESVYRHEIRPALTIGATAMNKILSKAITQHRRLALLRHYITDDHAPARIRAIACLMLLYAQPLSRVLRLAISGITRGDDGQLHIRFGHPPAPVPEPFAGLLTQLIADRPATSSNWLFPGRNPGQPAAYATIFAQLRGLGFPMRTARISALRQLVLQAPPPSSPKPSASTTQPPNASTPTQAQHGTATRAAATQNNNPPRHGIHITRHYAGHQPND